MFKLTDEIEEQIRARLIPRHAIEDKDYKVYSWKIDILLIDVGQEKVNAP